LSKALLRSNHTIVDPIETRSFQMQMTKRSHLRNDAQTDGFIHLREAAAFSAFFAAFSA
jgi:hypothetical protein